MDEQNIKNGEYAIKRIDEIKKEMKLQSEIWRNRSNKSEDKKNAYNKYLKFEKEWKELIPIALEYLENN